MRWRRDRSGAAVCFGTVSLAGGIGGRVYTAKGAGQGQTAEIRLNLDLSFNLVQPA
jgi:hypothetical protein